MYKNPYIYKGPLDPVKNRIVLISRTDDLKRVTDGIKRGEYWAILGIRQIGKTTFLRQIMKKLKNAYHLYINSQMPPKGEKNFYQWIISEFIEKIPSEQGKDISKYLKNDDRSFDFVKFLENFKPIKNKKIILMIDEIEGIPFLSNFLSVLRTIHQERNNIKQLQKYSFIIAGSVGLVASTIEGDNSPFDAAEIFDIKDFSTEESEQLIDKPFNRLNIKIERRAKEKLISLISGHPQMLQQACYNLVDTALKQKKVIGGKDIDEAINLLLLKNTTIATLKKDIKNNSELCKLVKSILEGKGRKYYHYKEFSITGAGCIIEGYNSSCVIRNKVYEQFLRDSPDIQSTNIELDEIISSADKTVLHNNPIKKYRFIETIGEGGMGKVIKAEDPGLNRPVAIKLLKKELVKNRNVLERFKREAQLPAGLDHENIVSVYDFIIRNDDCQLVMQFIDGKNFEEIITIGGSFTPSQIIYIANKMSKALIYLHKHEIIHRDIKPKNIMLTREGKIKLVDFGIAVIKEVKISGDTGSIRGTPQYMAPEQFYGEKPHYLTDIYSTGITLFHLAAGKVPFDGKKIENLREQHLKKPLPPLSIYRKDIGQEFEEIIKKCAAKDPKDRYQSAKELLDTLNLKWKSIDETAIENELKKKIGE